MKIGNLNYGWNDCELDSNPQSSYPTNYMHKQMKGAGLIDTISSTFKGLSNRAFTSAIKLLPKDELSREGFPGERHQILLKGNKLVSANFSGPFTKLLNRLRRGDMGISETDEVAKLHDILYTLAESEQDIRNADKRMIKGLNLIEKRKSDSKFNTRVAKAGIKAKMWLEDKKILPRNAITGKLKGVQDPELLALLNSSKDKLELKGYGSGCVIPRSFVPIRKGKKGKKGITRKKGKKQMKGEGFLSNFIIDRIFPSLMSALKIPQNVIKSEDIKKIVNQVIEITKDGASLSIPKLATNIAKIAIPLLIHAKNKISARPKVLKGKGIIKDVEAKLSKAGKALRRALKKDIQKLLISATAEFTGGQSVKISHSQLIGSGFFSSFAKGFKSVFKPVSRYLGPALSIAGTVLGQPEISVLGTLVKFLGDEI